jgi:6-phosphogluconolactonase
VTTAHIRAFSDRGALMQAAADRIAEALVAGIASRGFGATALSGGGTPAPAYELLAKMRLDWGRITFALVDERFVPPDHAASNEGLLRRTLAPALADGAAVAPMFQRDATLADAALRADAAYAALALDVALMGMGGDGHTASWFSDSPELNDALTSTQTVIAARAPSGDGASERLTLTRAAVARASRVLVLITGDEKRARLEAALRGNPEAAPVAALFDGAGVTPEVFWAP